MRAKFLKRAAALAVAAALPLAGASAADAAEIVGYYPGWKYAAFPVTAANVDASRLTMALYAFVDICWDGKHGNADPSVHYVAPCQEPLDGALAWRDEAADGDNLRKLVALKAGHPQFKVVISVGGWDWSNRFSNLAASPAARANFIASTVKSLRRYRLDGIDIDWEYPGEAGVPCVAGEVCARPDDKQNFVTLARELRAALDAAGTQDGKHYGITMAAGVTPRYVGDGQWLKDLAASLDWINLMTYDFHMPFEKTSNHLAPLFGDARDAANAGANTAGAVERYLQAGVARDKLVLGVPFYGYGWKGCPPGAGGDGQYQPCNGGTTSGINGGYAYGFDLLLEQGMLAPSLEGANGYRRYWNASARVPYLYNAAQQVWVSYEDPASLQEKARYIRQQGLRGAMFWEMSGDGQHRMLGALSQAMGK